MAITPLFGAKTHMPKESWLGTPPPVPVSAEVSLRGLTVTFDLALKAHIDTGAATGRPDGRAFTVEVTAPDGETRTLAGSCGSTGLGDHLRQDGVGVAVRNRCIRRDGEGELRQDSGGNRRS